MDEDCGLGGNGHPLVFDWIISPACDGSGINAFHKNALLFSETRREYYFVIASQGKRVGVTFCCLKSV